MRANVLKNYVPQPKEACYQKLTTHTLQHATASTYFTWDLYLSFSINMKNSKPWTNLYNFCFIKNILKLFSLRPVSLKVWLRQWQPQNELTKTKPCQQQRILQLYEMKRGLQRHFAITWRWLTHQIFMECIALSDEFTDGCSNKQRRPRAVR